MTTKSDVDKLREELSNLINAKFKPPYFDENMRNLIDSNIRTIIDRIKEAEAASDDTEE